MGLAYRYSSIAVFLQLPPEIYHNTTKVYFSGF
jgi:hypothetical protein